MSGYCTLPRPKNWPCACRVNIKSYFDRSALECHGCGMLVTGEDRVRMLFPDAQPAKKETFDAEAHRAFIRSLWMCSEIDARTRDNPEAAMVHHGYLTGFNQRGANQYYNQHDTHNWHEPGLTQWPKGDQKPSSAKPEARAFDAEAHRAFMRSLG